MQRYILAAAVAALTLGAAGCSGGYSTSSPTSPSPDPAPSGAITIDVIGINGARSFSPNPATVPPGQTVVWRNIDTTTHRMVLNDGRLDTGNIPPGGVSSPMTLAAPGGYHCTIHPEMIGTISDAR
jgi:plastocyanin